VACLSCVNARALPHQLPVQIAAADQITRLRGHLPAAAWQARYEPGLRQLNDILSSYSPAERARARNQLTGPQTRLLDELLDGKWDLR
jgi:hypothetical protein